MPTDTSPSATAPIERCQVIEQHGVLGELLRRVHDAATQVLQHEGRPREPLAELVSELRAHLSSHLAGEERARQWDEIDTLAAGAAWEPDRLALAARSLATDLLRDLDDAERTRLGNQASCAGRDDVEALDDVVNLDRATD
jgi:hypothetical protein